MLGMVDPQGRDDGTGLVAQASLQALRELGVPVQCFAPGRLRDRAPQEATEAVRAAGVTHFFTVGCELAGPEEADCLTALEAAGVRVGWWIVDEPRIGGWSVRHSPRCSFCFTHAAESVARHRAAGARIAFLPLAADPRATLPDPPDAPGRAGVCFVGRVNHPLRERLVAELPRRFPFAHRQDVTDPGEVARLYRRAAVSLDAPGWCEAPGVADGVGQRLFAIAVAGGCALTPARPGLEDLFQPDREVAVYRGFDELCAQIERCLAAPQERLRLARAAHDRARRDHAMAGRMARMLACLAPGKSW